MKKKDTDGLSRELMCSPDLEKFLSENRQEFVDPDIPKMLAGMLKRSGMSKTALAKNSGMSEVFLHQVFSGRRNPSRNRLLCLCFGMNASLDDTQELLKLCGYAQLYPKNRRDAILIYSITHGIDLFETNDSLFSQDEETLL